MSTKPSAPGPYPLDDVAASAEAAGEKIKDAVDHNPHLAMADDFSDTCFKKLGLEPADHVCHHVRCSSQPCGLRAWVYIWAVVQMQYGIYTVIMSVLSTLLGVVGVFLDLDPLEVVLLIIAFACQLITGIFLTVCGAYGSYATWDLEAIVKKAPKTMQKTRVYYRLSLMSIFVSTFCGLILAICQTILQSYLVLAVVWTWFWFVASLCLQLYALYIIWSYKTWLVLASTEWGSHSLARAVRLPQPVDQQLSHVPKQQEHPPPANPKDPKGPVLPW